MTFVTAVAYHFFLNLPGAFSRPGKHSFGDLCKDNYYNDSPDEKTVLAGPEKVSVAESYLPYVNKVTITSDRK